MFIIDCIICYTFTDKKVSGKSKDELGEKKHEIDKRLDVSGQLSTKKGKKGNLFEPFFIFMYIVGFNIINLFLITLLPYTLYFYNYFIDAKATEISGPSRLSASSSSSSDSDSSSSSYSTSSSDSSDSEHGK